MDKISFPELKSKIINLSKNLPDKKSLLIRIFIVVLILAILGVILFVIYHFQHKGISRQVKANEEAEVSFQQATLTVPKESLKKDTQITIKTATKPPLPSQNTQYIGQVYEFGPSLKFDQPAVVVLKYNLSDLPDPTREDNLYLATWEDDKWKPLEGIVIDKANHTVSAAVEHFSFIALIMDKINLVVGSGKIEEVSYDNLPSQIRNPLVEEGYGQNEVWVMQKIEFPTGLKLGSLVFVFANGLSKVTGAAIGSTQSKEEMIKAAAETVGKEIVKAQGKEGQLLVTAYKVGKGGVLIDKLASSGIAVVQGVQTAAELQLIYAKAIAWILTAEMDYINQHLEEPYKLLWKLNPGEGRQLEVYHIVVAVPGREGQQERRGEKWYYLNQATNQYENFYDNLAGSTIEFKAKEGEKAKIVDDKKVYLGDKLLLDIKDYEPGCSGFYKIDYSSANDYFYVLLGCFENDDRLFLFKADGSDKKEITGKWDVANNGIVDWDPDGKSFVYHRINSCCVEPERFGEKGPPVGMVRYVVATGEKTVIGPYQPPAISTPTVGGQTMTVAEFLRLPPIQGKNDLGACSETASPIIIQLQITEYVAFELDRWYHYEGKDNTGTTPVYLVNFDKNKQDWIVPSGKFEIGRSYLFKGCKLYVGTGGPGPGETAFGVDEAQKDSIVEK